MNQNMLEHLADIDFRTRAVRQKNAKKEFISWYEELVSRPYTDIVQGQLSMLSAVLWHMLTEKQYKRLTRRK